MRSRSRFVSDQVIRLAKKDFRWQIAAPLAALRAFNDDRLEWELF
jgi:hypothetical protein